MAEGLNVDQGAFASPVWEIAGLQDERATEGLDAYGEPSTSGLYDMGSLPSFYDLQPGPLGDIPDLAAARRVSARKPLPKTALDSQKRHAAGMGHWSDLLDVKHSTLAWLGVGLIAYFFLLDTQLHARHGRP